MTISCQELVEQPIRFGFPEPVPIVFWSRDQEQGDIVLSNLALGAPGDGTPTTWNWTRERMGRPAAAQRPFAGRKPPKTAKRRPKTVLTSSSPLWQDEARMSGTQDQFTSTRAAATKERRLEDQIPFNGSSPSKIGVPAFHLNIMS